MSAEPTTYDVIMSLVAHLGTLRGWRIVSMQAMIAPGGEPHVRAEGANASLRLTFTRHNAPVLAIEVNVTTHRGPTTTAVLSRIESPVMLVASPRPSEWADILRRSVVELSAARQNSDIIAEPAAWGLIAGGLDEEDVGDPDSGPLTSAAAVDRFGHITDLSRHSKPREEPTTDEDSGPGAMSWQQAEEFGSPFATQQPVESPRRNCWTCRYNQDPASGSRERFWCSSPESRMARAEWAAQQKMDVNGMPPKDSDGCPGYSTPQRGVTGTDIPEVAPSHDP